MSFWIGVTAILTATLIGCGKGTGPKATAPEVSDIPDRGVAPGEDFESSELDDFVEDPDDTDAEITWTVSGNAQIAGPHRRRPHSYAEAPLCRMGGR